MAPDAAGDAELEVSLDGRKEAAADVAAVDGDGRSALAALNAQVAALLPKLDAALAPEELTKLSGVHLAEAPFARLASDGRQ